MGRIIPVAGLAIAFVGNPIPGVPVLIPIVPGHLFPQHNEGFVVGCVQLLVCPGVENEITIAVVVDDHGKINVVAERCHSLCLRL